MLFQILKLSTLILIIFSINSFAQAQDLPTLGKQVAVLYQQGKFNEAVPLAEKIVEIQRANKANNSQNLINAIENLSQVKLGRFKQSRQTLAGTGLDKDNAEKIVNTINKDGKDIESHVREALNLSEKEPKKNYIQIISLRNELAWILYNFFPPGAEPNFGVSKEDRDKYESFLKIRYYDRVNEAEKLYSQALKESETNFGEENDITLLTAYNSAEFDMAAGNFENAIPLYEKCIKIIEKKYGAENENLVLPLQSYAKMLTATNQIESAAEVTKRLQKITNKTEDFSKILLNISSRTERSFTLTNGPLIENQAQNNEGTVSLAAHSAAALRGVSSGQILASSTSGKTYYENYCQMRLMSVPVRVLVDEKGKVIEAEAMTQDKSLKTAAEKVVKDWTFNPFNLKDQMKKLSGYVECLFVLN